MTQDLGPEVTHISCRSCGTVHEVGGTCVPPGERGGLTDALRASGEAIYRWERQLRLQAMARRADEPLRVILDMPGGLLSTEESDTLTAALAVIERLERG